MLSEFEFGTSKSRDVHAKSRDVYISASPFFLGLMHLKPTKKSFVQRIDLLFWLSDSIGQGAIGP